MGAILKKTFWQFLSSPDESSGLRASLIGHGAVFLAVIGSQLVFRSTPTPYIPSLKVDLVGLPSDLKNTVQSAKRKKLRQEISELLKAAEENLKKAAQAKVVKEDLGKSVHTQVIKPKENRESRNQQALNRMRLLSKLKDFSDANSEENAVEEKPIRGNQISPGSSLSGEARENAVSGYYDDLRERIQTNWALPAWLARQNLSAQIQLYIDASGRVKNLEWIRSSGIEAFDEGIKRSISESEPFAKVPSEIQNLMITRGVLIGFPL